MTTIRRLLRAIENKTLQPILSLSMVTEISQYPLAQILGRPQPSVLKQLRKLVKLGFLKKKRVRSAKGQQTDLYCFDWGGEAVRTLLMDSIDRLSTETVNCYFDLYIELKPEDWKSKGSGSSHKEVDIETSPRTKTGIIKAVNILLKSKLITTILPTVINQRHTNMVDKLRRVYGSEGHLTQDVGVLPASIKDAIDFIIVAFIHTDSDDLEDLLEQHHFSKQEIEAIINAWEDINVAIPSDAIAPVLGYLESNVGKR